MNPLWTRLLPQPIDNTYRGAKLALRLYGVIVLSKFFMSLNCIVNGRYVMTRADGIPLDSFTPQGAQTALGLIAIWGLAHLTICLLCILAFVRYRAMVPLMFALLLVEHLSRRVLLYFEPLARVGTSPGFVVNLVLLVLMAAGLVLSLRGRSGGRAHA